MNLLTMWIRNISKFIGGGAGTRPDVPEAGTNHVDDYADWTENTIYSGELAIELEGGRLFTHDNIENIELNTEDVILFGLSITSAGPTSRYISVSEGSFRLNGRSYYFVPPSDVSDTSTYIEENTTGFGRLDVIAATGDLENFDSIHNMYGIKFKIFRGSVSSSPAPPTVPDGYILLGMVYVPPQSESILSLYPLTYSEDDDTMFPLQVINSAEFFRMVQRELRDWTIHTLLFEGQVVKSGNKLYSASITHQSDVDLLANDLASGKLVDINFTIADNINFLADYGNPSDGNLDDGYFYWVGTTRIIDAFDNISDVVNKLVPDSPKTFDQISLIVDSLNFYSAKTLNDLSSITFIVDGISSDIHVKTNDTFFPADRGSLKASVASNETDYIDLVPTIHPPAAVYTETGTNFQFDVTKNDEYAEIESKEGFFNSILAEIIYDSQTDNPTIGQSKSFSISYTDPDSNVTTKTIDVYFDSITTDPTISSVSDVAGTWNGKFISGIPVLDDGCSVSVSITIANSISYFINPTRILSIESEQSSDSILDITSVYLAESIPFSHNETLHFNDVSLPITSDSNSGFIAFDCTAYRTDDTVGDTSSTISDLIVDQYVEIGNRLFAGIGTYPTTGYGTVYDSTQSAESLTTVGNEELLYHLGKYQYPTTDYSSISYDTILGPQTGPDYSSISGYRWTIFDLGTVSNVKFLKLRINDSENIGEDWLDGETMTDGFAFQIKIEGVTGWLDGNSSYNYGNPISDGDSSLDTSDSIATIRRITFGDTVRSGQVYVRVGILDGYDIKFSDVSLLDNTAYSNLDTPLVVELYDEEAPTNSLYWSLTQNAVVYKDHNGSIRILGSIGSTGNIDFTGLIWRTEWDSATTYLVNDLVYYDGSAYVAIENNDNSQPDLNPTDWQIFTQKGDVGATGQGLTWKGTWNSGTAYSPYDLIEYSGSGYICIFSTTNDIPSSSPTKWELISQKGADGLGTVTSIGISVPTEFSVSGSPVTSSGTISISKANQNANLIYAGPTSGGAAAPTFRSLVTNDLADDIIITSKISDGSITYDKLEITGVSEGTYGDEITGVQITVGADGRIVVLDPINLVGVRQLIFPIMQLGIALGDYPTQDITMPASLTEVYTDESTSTTGSRLMVDLTYYVNARIVVNVESVGASTNSKFAIQYSIDGGSSWDYLNSTWGLETPGPIVTLSTAGVLNSDWVSTDFAARTETTLLRLVKLDGTNNLVQVTNMYLHFK